MWGLENKVWLSGLKLIYALRGELGCTFYDLTSSDRAHFLMKYRLLNGITKNYSFMGPVGHKLWRENRQNGGRWWLWQFSIIIKSMILTPPEARTPDFNPPKHESLISRPKNKLVLQFWTIFRSQRAVLMTFPPCNMTHERINKK